MLLTIHEKSGTNIMKTFRRGESVKLRGNKIYILLLKHVLDSKSCANGIENIYLDLVHIAYGIKTFS